MSILPSYNYHLTCTLLCIIPRALLETLTRHSVLAGPDMATQTRSKLVALIASIIFTQILLNHRLNAIVGGGVHPIMKLPYPITSLQLPITSLQLPSSNYPLIPLNYLVFIHPLFITTALQRPKDVLFY